MKDRTTGLHHFFVAEELRGGGARVVSLGPRILRTATAGPVAAAIVAYTYGTLG